MPDIDPDILQQLQGFQKFENKYLEQRKVFLWGPVMDESIRKAVDRILFLEAEAPGEEISLYVNSPGGVVTSGLVLMDTMRMISSPVATICMGMCASMGAMILSHGEKGSRRIYPHGRVMIHQPSIGGTFGQASDLEITTKEILKTKELSAQILAENCGQTEERVREDFDRDYWMDADEAVDYGIVDSIAENF